MRAVLTVCPGPLGALAVEYAQEVFDSVHVVRGSKGTELNMAGDCDYLLSFLSRLIVPEWYLRARVGKDAINWHPAPPQSKASISMSSAFFLT